MQQWIIKELLLQDIAFVNGSDRILREKKRSPWSQASLYPQVEA
jgi:hypothetical protein